MIPRWFLYLQGFAMLIMGIALLVVRPKRDAEGQLTRFLSFGTAWALVCCLVGVGLLGLAFGYLAWPHGLGLQLRHH